MEQLGTAMVEIALSFVSHDGATVKFSTEAVAAMVAATRKRPDRETGGILIGRYSSDLTVAWVEAITDEPWDSRAGRTWFVRGTAGLKKLLKNFWRDGRHYIGEWHSHPNYNPDPSFPDLSAIQAIARKSDFVCRRPILVVIGGDLQVMPLLTVTLASPDGTVNRLAAKYVSD